jgi:hypothetical protein
MAKRTGKTPGSEAAGKPRPAPARKPRVRRPKQPVDATEEVERTEPERAPLPDPSGLAHTMSPVDLPDPPVPLGHGLRWASIVIAVATAVLALLNAHSLRSWSYQLPPNARSAQIVAAAETWYDAVDPLGLNRPVAAMHDGWQSLKDRRFDGEPPTAESAQR